MSNVKAATIRCWGPGGFFGNIFLGNKFLFIGKMGEINKWPQGMVEIQPIWHLR